jgi:stearoyl-CoA desaturase (delta-9 desaturase)
MGDIQPINLKSNLSWVTIGFFTLVHVGALLALHPAFFSWSAVGVMFLLYWITASLGICLGFHRYLTHRSFELPRWLAYFFAFCGTLACENGPIKWVAQHRMHHAHSDQDLDPHDARKGFFWCHFGWMIYTNHYDDPKKIEAFSKDLQDDKFYQFLDRNFIYIQVALGLFLFALGGMSFVIWGIFFRLALVYHATWFVNSAAHMWGYRNVKLEHDLSTNCWWVGLMAWGEGWHNNHHAFPSSARHGLRWWEIDLTWASISVLKWLGLAKNIKVVQLTRDTTNDVKGYFSGEITKQAA